MNGLRWFLLGVSAGLFLGGAVVWHINNRWYHRAHATATAITNDFTETLRMVANYIPDKEISDALIDQANKCDEVWR